MKRHAPMNRIYRLAWSQVLNTWIAVAETARGRGKGSARNLVAATLMLTAQLAHASPSGGQVTAGTGTIAQPGSTTTVTQTSQNLSLSWDGFNTTAGETVNFVQPSVSAVAVNRIYDVNGTTFFGSLNANGQVYLINPNGILFGVDSQVNVGGLVASTLDINDASLNSASRSFSGPGTGSIVNQGTLNGRYVALLGNTVSNQGAITAPMGAVALGAGSAVTLSFADNHLVRMQVDQSTLDNLAQNGGLIQADGGMVLLTAGAKDTLLASVVNNSGVIEARSVQNVNGTIVLDGGNLGTVTNSGALDASGRNAGETGGMVKALGKQVDLLAGTNVDVSGDAGGGTALIGGNYQGKGPEQNATTVTVATGATLNADALTSGDGGMIVAWSDGHTSVDGAFSARGGADGGNGGVVETSGKKLTVGDGTRVNTLAPKGKTGDWLLDPADFTIGCVAADNWSCITTINGDITDKTLSRNLGNVDLGTGGSGTNITILSGQGTLVPNGNGDITLAGSATDVAWLSWSDPTTLTLSAYRNVNVNGVISPLDYVGNGSIVLRADNTATGVGTVNIAAGLFSGGSSFIGTQGSGSTTIYTNAPTATTGYKADDNNFFGTFNVYQLVHADSAGVVNNKTYDGGTTATVQTAFGLVGTPAGATLNAGTATFDTKNVGTGKTVTFSGYSASGTVGLAGGVTATYYLSNQPGSKTANITPASLTVSGIKVGNKTYDATTAATVNTADAVLTGLIGGDTVTVSATGTFADKNVGNYKTVTLTSSYGGADAGNYAITGQASATANITPASLTISGITGDNRVYDGTTAATVNTAGAVLTGLIGGDTVTVSATGTFADKNVGNYKTVTLASSSGGADAGNYTITDQASTTANITPAALTLDGITADNKVYDGTTSATLNTAGVTFTGLVGSDAVTLGGAGSGTFADKNVGTGKTVTVSGYTLGGADAGNYTVGQATGLTADITPASLTVSGIKVGNKTYDATTAATVNTADAVLTGLIGGDTVTVSATGTFADKNVGNYKTVTLTSSYGGADAGNYAITGQASATANITPASLTISGITADNKTYDATTAATVSTAGAVLTGLIGNDTVTVSATGTFADKNVGNGKIVTLSSTYDGADAGNYTITDQVSTTANITPATLAVTANDASKSYDGAAWSGGSGVAYSGLTGGDTAATVLSGTLTYGGTSQGATNPGTYAITPGGLGSNANYLLGYVNGVLTIYAPPAPRPLLQAPQNTIAMVSAGLQPSGLSPSPIITVDGGEDGNASAGTNEFSQGGFHLLADTTQHIGDMGVTLHIVTGGIRLPDNLGNPTN